MFNVPSPLYKIGDPAFKTDPWPYYERLRDSEPVHLTTPSADVEAFYVLSRYDDVAMAIKDKTRFSSHIRRTGYLDLPIMINRDHPDHTRLRRVTNRSFGPRALNKLTDRMQQVLDDLVAELLSKPKVEFVEEFSTEVLLRIVGGMLGVPIGQKVDIQRGSEAALEVAFVIGGLDPDVVPGFYDDFMWLCNFIDQHAAERVSCPRDDVLTDLVNREAGGEITHDELVGLGWNYISAGQDTTMNLLSGGMVLLMSDPPLVERLIAEPEKTDDFMDEYLRLYSPVEFVLRRLEEDVELHGVVMPAGSMVHLVLSSANRDPRKFANPEVFDLDRPNVGDHLAFSGGPHFCPGTALARVASRIAFRTLYPVVHRFSPDPERPRELRTRPGAFGIEHMGLLVSQDEPAQALA